MSTQPIFDALATEYGWGCTASLAVARDGSEAPVRCRRTPRHDGPHENGSLTWTGISGLSVATGPASAALGYPRTTR